METKKASFETLLYFKNKQKIRDYDLNFNCAEDEM